MLIAVTAYRDSNFFVYSPDFIHFLYGEASKVVPVATTYPEFFAHNWIFIFDIVLLAWIIGKFMGPREGLDGTAAMKDKLAELPALTREEKLISFILAALVLFLLTYQFHHIPMVYGFIAAAIAFYLPCINIGTDADIKKVNFSVLFFIVACLSIGSVAQNIGINNIISELLVPLLSDISQESFIIFTYLLAVFANFFMTPLAEIATFGAPLAQICQSLDFNIHTMIYAFFHGTQQLLFPYETAVYLVAYSMGTMKLNDFTLIMAIKLVVNTILLVTVAFFYWRLIGIM